MPTPPAGDSGEALPQADGVFAPIQQINEYLKEVTEGLALPASLTDAMLYSLLAPGKRLRPVLTWHACAACGGRAEWALPAAAAVEFIHTFSLVHDDLPALDNDDLRRGRPTLHKHASEAMAILAGDAMLSAAFKILIERAPGPAAGGLIRELSEATTEMIAGQVYDTLGGPTDAKGPLDALIAIHSRKTGALIRAAARMGAISAGSAGRTAFECERDLEAITEYGEAIGLAFQAVDDLLDVTQTTSQLGKTSGKDQEQGKQTYPSVLGVERTREEIARLREEATRALKVLGPAGAPLEAIAGFICDRTR
ncbi:MAG: polyprenyl synthetase family protein [Phycisphaerales bacterium]